MPSSKAPVPPHAGDPLTPRVAWISYTPVKGLALLQPRSVMLEECGVADNRRFYLVDAEGRLVNNKRVGPLATVVPSYDDATWSLRMQFPGGEVVEATVELGEAVTTSFFGRPVEGRRVLGPWSGALSGFVGRELQLVRVEQAGAGVDRGRWAGVSLLSTASLARLAEALGGASLDPRRFRMLLGAEGVGAHEEDAWLGRRVHVGEAVVVPRGHVGRCLVTSQDPASGLPDLDTLGVLRRYRGGLATSEPVAFGVWGMVVEPGKVSLGDPLRVEG